MERLYREVWGETTNSNQQSTINKSLNLFPVPSPNRSVAILHKIGIKIDYKT